MSHLNPVVDYCYRKMIKAKICLFPGPYIVKTNGGMKSGWSLTALDNTISHLLTILPVLKIHPRITSLCYGDDNISCSPNEEEL